jgi:protein-tyrosine phosphatase
VIDVHCHVLPGIDDGPVTVEAALALAQALVDDGVTHAVLTPHVFPGRFDNRCTTIADDFVRFRELVEAAGLKLGLSWAGEVRLTPEVLELLALNELPFLGRCGEFQTMLLEMPDGQIPLGSLRFVQHLMSRKVRPVLVHPERNRMVMESPERLRPLHGAGLLCAGDGGGSVVGQFGDRARTTAGALLDKGWVHAVASDAHNLAGRRPRMRDARTWLQTNYGAALAQQLTETGPASICGWKPGQTAGAAAVC